MPGPEALGSLARIGHSEPLMYPFADGTSAAEPQFTRYAERPFVPESPENQLLRGKVALVTGVGDQRGLGPAIAWEFARHGAELMMTATARSTAEGQDLADVLRGHGVNAEWGEYDLTDQDARGNLMTTTLERFGRVDILVANAGIRKDGLLISSKESDLREAVDINVISPFMLAQEAVNKMRKQTPKGGAIIFTSSLAKEGNPGQAIYSLTKGAIHSLGMTMAKEYGPSGIRTNILVPGLIPQTKMTEDLRQRDVDRLLLAIGTPEPASADQVARAAVLAASEQHGMNGQSLIVSGQEQYNYSEFPIPQQ